MLFLKTTTQAIMNFLKNTLTDARKKITNWYEGKRTKAPDTKYCTFVGFDTIERHWTANAIHFLVDLAYNTKHFISENLKWCISTGIALAAFYFKH